MSRGKLVIYSTAGVRLDLSITATKGPTNEQLNKAVGGYFERVRVRFEGRVRDAYVNENGLAEKLPENDIATAMLHGAWRQHRIVGPIAIWVPQPRSTK